MYFFVFTSYFCLYLNFIFADFGLHGPYHVTILKLGSIILTDKAKFSTSSRYYRYSVLTKLGVIFNNICFPKE